MIFQDLNYFKFYEHDYPSPLACDVVGDDNVNVFLTRYCRIATPQEVKNAGFVIEREDDKNAFRMLLSPPPKIVTVPGLSGPKDRHSLSGTWQYGSVFHISWIQETKNQKKEKNSL